LTRCGVYFVDVGPVLRAVEDHLEDGAVPGGQDWERHAVTERDAAAGMPAVFLVVAAGVALRYLLGRQRHREILSELQTRPSAG